MSIHITPVLKFEDNCDEAMKFYRRTLDGILEKKTTFGQLTKKQQQQVEELGFSQGSQAEKIVWAMLEILNSDDIELVDSDLAFDLQHYGHAVSLELHNIDDAISYFDNLSEGGTVTVRLEHTLWSERMGIFGLLTDKFGVEWLIRVTP